MPLVRISLLKGKPASYRRKVGDAIHQALVETINVPAKDRFQVITEHDPEDVWINLVEVAKENWSFGNGVASYAPEEAALA